MNTEMFYNIKTVPLADRETFNNTILLLSMVKSEYYYIIGFSRPKNTISVGFDFESPLHRKIPQRFTVDFSRQGFVIIKGFLQNVEKNSISTAVASAFSGQGRVALRDDGFEYSLQIKRDGLMPLSIEKMNEYVLLARSEMIRFSEECYQNIITAKGKN